MMYANRCLRNFTFRSGQNVRSPVLSQIMVCPGLGEGIVICETAGGRLKKNSVD